MTDIGLIDHLHRNAALFAADLAACDDTGKLTAPDFCSLARRDGTLSKSVVWINDIFKSPVFRWAHVEFFSIADQIAVIHVCVFPHFDHAAPIFGFDIIASCHKATGAFLDLSPTVDVAEKAIAQWGMKTKKDRAGFSDHRDLPDWAAEIFSPSALAIRPVSLQEVDDVLALGRASLAMWLDQPAITFPAAQMMAAQRRYVEGQRRNQHTFRMLSTCVGPALAREFIDDWLFPTP
jgi:phycocyanobilin:ferredoxin oxidoreductase